MLWCVWLASQIPGLDRPDFCLNYQVFLGLQIVVMNRYRRNKLSAVSGPAEVLYIHPHGHLNELVVPAGVISSMNAINATRLGRYAFEVTDTEIRNASVIALDLHWSCGITGFEPMVERIRRVNPKAVIIVGGITAGLVPETILARYPVDYVIQGDSEVAFARLVDTVLRGRRPGGIPNVSGRGLSTAAPRRMTSKEFDRNDCLTIDWFPTFQRVTGLQAAAFGLGRTIPVVRGCRMRCPHCYGSCASVFGTGTLTMTPWTFRATLQQAEDMQVEELRLIMGKLSPRRLSELVGALRGLKLKRLPSAVGLFLCTPPTPTDLAILEDVFPTGIHISLVPPTEHVPAMSPRGLAKELRAWEEAARYVAQSDRLRLDIWTDGELAIKTPAQAIKIAGGSNAKVSRSTVWHMFRMVDHPDSPDWDEVRRAVRPIWTFYASRLLSPTLASLLAPYHMLDEIDDPPPDNCSAPAQLTDTRRRVETSWQTTHLPTLPDMVWWTLPLRMESTLLPKDSESGVYYHGNLGRTRTQAGIQPLPQHMQPMEVTIDDVGVRLSAPLGCTCDGVAVVPWPSGEGRPDTDWIELLAFTGMCVLDLRDVPAAQNPTTGMQLHAIIRIHGANLALLDDNGVPLARGHADMNYYRKPVQAMRLPTAEETDPRCNSSDSRN